jgi:hypothetical protein
MVDFIQSNETKSAVHKLADPIADIAAFNTIVQSVITTNPLACVPHMTAQLNHDTVEKTRRGYAIEIITAE